MTLQEVSIKYGFSQSSIKTQFKRTAASIQKKYNVTLTRYYNDDGQLCYEATDGRAETFYDEQETKQMKIGKPVLRLNNFEFIVFLGIVMTPWGVFRGAREEFLKYISVKKNKKNLELLEQSLANLINQEYIAVCEDGKHVIIYIREKIEEEMNIGPKMIKRCRDIAKKNNKTFDKTIQLMKVWLAIQICYKDQPFTSARLEELTNLSSYQIREAIKLLENEGDIFKTSRVGNYMYCQGKNVDLCPWW